MGGRSVWIEYVTKSPIYWYIMGFPITKSFISAFLCGVISAVIIPVTSKAIASYLG